MISDPLNSAQSTGLAQDLPPSTGKVHAVGSRGAFGECHLQISN